MTATLPTVVTDTSPGSFLRGCLTLQLCLAAIVVLGVVTGVLAVTIVAGLAALANALVLCAGLRRL